VTKNVEELNGISQIATAGPVVRNDEAVGSIPTSSTIFPITYEPSAVHPCHTLSQKIRFAGVCCLKNAHPAQLTGLT